MTIIEICKLKLGKIVNLLNFTQLGHHLTPVPAFQHSTMSYMQQFFNTYLKKRVMTHKSTLIPFFSFSSWFQDFSVNICDLIHKYYQVMSHTLRNETRKFLFSCDVYFYILKVSYNTVLKTPLLPLMLLVFSSPIVLKFKKNYKDQISYHLIDNRCMSLLSASILL